MIGYPLFTSDTIIIERDNNSDTNHNRVMENDLKSMVFAEIMKDLVQGLILNSIWIPFMTVTMNPSKQMDT